MLSHQALLLVGAVAAVGILHTLVPDHWVPIASLARQQGWSGSQTARAAAIAGLGHTVSTLAIGVLVCLAGAAFALRFGHALSLASGAALICFGLWTAAAGWREARSTHIDGAAGVKANVRNSKIALLLILGSSPMVEGLPAFFAASRFGLSVLAMMSGVFAAATIATYVALCTTSAKTLARMRFQSIERYGEALSGAVIALVGFAFLWS